METKTTSVGAGVSRRRSKKWVPVLGLIVLLLCGAGVVAGTLVMTAVSGYGGNGVGVGDAVAIVRVEGTIGSGERPGGYASGVFSEEIIKHLRRSPNKGDAACYGNFVRKRGKFTRKEEIEEVKEGKNRDVGLERFLGEHAEASRKEERQVRRLMMHRARARKRMAG